jgi:hypothetical protein
MDNRLAIANFTKFTSIYFAKFTGEMRSVTFFIKSACLYGQKKGKKTENCTNWYKCALRTFAHLKGKSRKNKIPREL